MLITFCSGHLLMNLHYIDLVYLQHLNNQYNYAEIITCMMRRLIEIIIGKLFCVEL